MILLILKKALYYSFAQLSPYSVIYFVLLVSVYCLDHGLHINLKTLLNPGEAVLNRGLHRCRVFGGAPQQAAQGICLILTDVKLGQQAWNEAVLCWHCSVICPEGQG